MLQRHINDQEVKLLQAILNSYGNFTGKPALINQLEKLHLEISKTPEARFLKILNGQPTDCKLRVLEARYEDYDTADKKRSNKTWSTKEGLLWCVPHVCVLFHIGAAGQPIALELFKEDSTLLQKPEPIESDLLDLDNLEENSH